MGETAVVRLVKAGKFLKIKSHETRFSLKETKNLRVGNFENFFWFI